jgi:carboxypeptidase PM20D1
MRRLLVRILLVLAAAVVVVAAVAVVRAVRLPTPAPEPPAAAALAVDEAAAAGRLAAALRFPTVSSQADQVGTGGAAGRDPAPFLAFHAWLAETFPRVHATLAPEPVAGLSLLYTWPGRDPSLAPVLLMAHQDVVPVEAGTEGSWTHPPFAGEVADGWVWGRGSLDDKGSLVSILEAVEALLGEGFSPARTVYLAFGHDEEVGGSGAQAMAALLAARGVHLLFALDEGGMIVADALPGLAAPLAVVGVAEKGYLTVELSVAGEGGHSSRPPRETAIGILSRAIAALEAHPMPARLDGATERMLAAVASSMPFGRRLPLANLWLCRHLVTRMLAADPATDATIRTTTAPTLLRAGEKENALPQRATATVNFRILPGDTVAGVLDHVRRAVDDPRVAIRPLGPGTEPSAVSSATSEAFGLIARTARQAAPGEGLVVAPYLVIGATDSRHFAPLADDVYRFVGAKIVKADLARVHGTDERIAVGEYARAIRFYARLLRNLDELPAASG